MSYKLLITVLVIFIISSCAQNDKKKSNHKTNAEVSNVDIPDTLDIDTQVYLTKGKSIAIATKDVLGKQLINAINTRGTDKALEFCNIKAIPLTDSMSIELNARVKRVTDKYRNPENAANEMELAYMKLAKQEIEKNGSATPKVFELDNHIIGYYPIVTNALCLQCHGNIDTDIKEATKLALQKNYPNDLATGYTVNELRGLWVIEMSK